jgi:hypothetical protein
LLLLAAGFEMPPGPDKFTVMSERKYWEFEYACESLVLMLSCLYAAAWLRAVIGREGANMAHWFVVCAGRLLALFVLARSPTWSRTAQERQVVLQSLGYHTYIHEISQA